ncbi:MAG: hypothetical protein KF887_02820 [Paracoccaceae bacterium]|nr:MAG: hypothetical protein KF887_02820 [Paracoccaceae bacterium]
MNDPLHLIRTPLGQPGSGRVRYGAAMALFRDGTLSEAQLDVYRDAAAHDGRDPLPMLAERGLPPPPGSRADPADRLARLAVAAEDYLAAFDLPGASEVRRGLASRRGPPVVGQPNAHPVVDRWMPAALDAMSPDHAALRGAIAAAAPLLDWQVYDGYPLSEIGEDFAMGHAFATLMGGDAPYPAEGFDFGLFLIAPQVLYRDHVHKAPELYAPLTGPHGWRFGTGLPLDLRPAHDPVWNDPDRPHLIKVGAVPFLAFYGWTRDVNEPAFVLPADDWSELEALRL